MSAIKLVIGDKSRSSWSLRAWLFLKHHGVPFTEQLITLDAPDTRRNIIEQSPSGRVPLLVHGAVQVWESSAICEYAAETFALPLAWPLNPSTRAFARSIAAEMHAGFGDLRKELPFYAWREPQAQDYSERAGADIRRICAIWREARPKPKPGRWLFGEFGIADAMFAPVALRFHIYNVKLDTAERDYVHTVLEHPAVKLWIEGAMQEQAGAPAPAVAAPEPAPEPAPPPKPRGLVVVPTALASKPAAAPPTAAPAAPAAPAAVMTPAPPPVAAPPPPAAPAPARTAPAKPAPAAAPKVARAPVPPPTPSSPAELRPATPIPDLEPLIDMSEVVIAPHVPIPESKELRPASAIPDPEPAATSSGGPPPRFKSVIMPPD